MSLFSIYLMLQKLLVILGALWALAYGSVLSTVDFVNYAEDTWTYSYSNTVGLSMDLSEFIPEMNNNLLQLYLMNSNVYGDWYSNFAIEFHNPGGIRYNCSLLDEIANDTLPCVYDMKNDSFLTALGNFNWNTTMSYALSIYWDNQGADFSNDVYMKNLAEFARTVRTKSRQAFFTALSDKADTYNATGVRPDYSYTQPAADCASFNLYLFYTYSAPGLTEDASNLWYSQMRDISYECGLFTIRGTVFKNPADLTIANLLSENYTSEYIKRRLTIDGTSFLSSLSSNLVSFNQLRLVDQPEGVDGLTNSFAAAIWAIEFVMEWIIAGGTRVSFYNPIANASFQSVLGQSPTFAPTSLYYGLLMAIIGNYNSPWIMRPTISSGTSMSIQAYGLEDWGRYSFLLLNKDTNPNASGTVDVRLSYTSGISCMYLSAENLTSTEGISFNGLSFVANSSIPVGDFVGQTYYVNSQNLYNVPLNYSQVVLCRTLTARTYYYFPRKTRNSSEMWLQFGLLLMLLLVWS